MKLRNTNGEDIEIDIGEMVICLSSTEPQWYDVGQIFKCVNAYSMIHIEEEYDEDDTPTYGGDYGTWERYYPNDSLEDLL